MHDDDLRLTRPMLAALRKLNWGPLMEKQGTDLPSVRALVSRGLARWAGPDPQRIPDYGSRGQILTYKWQWNAVITDAGRTFLRRLDADPRMERQLIK
jgi:hypothetical protein